MFIDGSGLSDEHLAESLTTDHHFDQAGFVRLLDR